MKTIIGPWSQNYPGTLIQGELEFPVASKADKKFHRKYFDYWLRTIQNGFNEEPSLNYYQLGENIWKNATTWPPPGTSNTNYYLHTGGDLKTTAPTRAEGSNDYIFDPNDPSPGIGGEYIDPSNFYPNPTMGPAYIDDEVLDGRDDYVVFDSDILEENLVIAGNPLVRLYVQSDVVDTDIIVRLCDYDPEKDQTLLINIRPLRMRYREGLRKEVWMGKDQIYEADIQLDPTAYTFKKGHKVRMIVSSSAYPLYAINPNNGDHFMPGTTGTDSDSDSFNIANVQLWSNTNYPAHLTLPVQN
jgi:putative CocE/NonD family hydrolase